MLEMERKMVTLLHKDKNYAQAMCARLSLIVRGIKLAAAADAALSDGEEIYEMKNYMAVSEVAADLASKYSPDCSIKGTNECSLIGFTSAAGGCGTTAAAVSLGRSYAQIQGLRTLYVSFDTMSAKYSNQEAGALEYIYSLAYGKEAGNARLNADDYGLWTISTEGLINPCSFLDAVGAASMFRKLSKLFDRIVVDIPLDHASAFELFDLCDDLVICLGWQEDRQQYSTVLARHLENIGLPVHVFAAEYDEFGTEDIYGQFGSEVRALAREFTAS